MNTLFNRFIKDESGATAIEYGLIAALLAVAIIASLNLVSTELKAVFGKVQTELTKAAATPTS
jgi:pilus assembly protein Flp/PilA